MTGSPGDTGLSTDFNPYVGPRPLREGQGFYGRDDDVRRLYYLLSAERIVLLHSPSGAGKSSLINAGLIPRLREDFDVWPPTRVNLEPDPANPSLNRYIRSIILSLEEGLPQLRRRPAAEIGHQSLAEYVARRPCRPSAPRQVVLIFDQFEEVLTVDPVGIAAKSEFFDELGALLESNKWLWALFAMREDYLAALEPYRKKLPTRLTHTFRLDMLGLAGGFEATVRPAQEAGRSFDEQAATRLVRDLATVQVQQPDGSFCEEVGQCVEPMQLQVVCRRLWESLTPEVTTIREGDLTRSGDVDAALAGYYDDAVRRACKGDKARERATREWFSERLITPAGTRGQVLRGTDESGGLPTDLVDEMRAAHLVRAEKRAGAAWYEIAHDRLIGPIRRSNAAWLQANLHPMQQQATLWIQQGRPQALLLRDRQLAEAQAWATESAALLAESERDFLARSVTKQRDRRLVHGLLGALALGTVLGVALLVRVYLTTVQMHTQARALGLMAAAGARVADGDNQSALLLGLKARELSLSVTMPPGFAHRLDQVLSDATVGATEGVRLLGHTRAVVWAEASPDGCSYVTASEDGTARVWTTAGRCVAILNAAQGPVRHARFSPDSLRVLVKATDGASLWTAEGELLQAFDAAVAATLTPAGSVLTSDGSVIRLWDETEETAPEYIDPAASTDPLYDPIRLLAYDPDGDRFASISIDGTLLLWSTNGKVEREFGRRLSSIVSLDFFPDSHNFVTASWSRVARIWSMDGTAHQDLHGHNFALTDAVVSRDGTLVATASYDGNARVWKWDGTTATAAGVLSGHRATIYTVDVSPRGDYLVTASADGTARVWDRDNHEFFRFDAHEGAVYSAFFVDEGRQVLTASADGTAQIWYALGSPNSRMLGHSDSVVSATFASDGRRVLTAANDNTARTWERDAHDRWITTAIFEGHTDRLSGACYAPDGTWVATASRDGSVGIWDLSGALRARFVHGAPVLGVDISPDGQLIVSAGQDGRVVLLGRDGRQVREIRGPAGFVMHAHFSPDGSRIATAHADGTARVWSVASGQQRLSVGNHESPVYDALYSPDGGQIVTAREDRTIRLYDALDGRDLGSLVGGHVGSVRALSFSADGQHLLSTSDDRTALVWNLKNREVVLRLGGGDSFAVYGGSLSPDGKTAVTGSYRPYARVWPIDKDGIVKRAIERNWRHDLTPAEGQQMSHLFHDKPGRQSAPGAPHE